MEKNELIAAQTNGLKSAIHSLEVQITILKTLVGSDNERPDTAASTAPKRTGGKKTAPKAETFDDEEVQETESFDSDDSTGFMTDEEEVEAGADDAPVAKSTKKAATKKITIDDVNDACMARAQSSNRSEVMAVLHKFGVKTVTKLKPEQYGQVIDALNKKGKK